MHWSPSAPRRLRRPRRPRHCATRRWRNGVRREVDDGRMDDVGANDDGVVHISVAAARLGISRRTVDRLMREGRLLRVRGTDGRSYVTASSVSALAGEKKRPFRRGAAKDELSGLLTALERLVGVAGDDRSALLDAIRGREQARADAAELRGQLSVERARVRQLEELLLAVARSRTGASELAEEVVQARAVAIEALSAPTDAATVVERLSKRTAAAAGPEAGVDSLRAAFLGELERVRGADLESSEHWAGWRDGCDVPGTAYERLLSSPNRRSAGQFQTPFPVADVMAAWLTQKPIRRLLDPAVGSGRLLFRTCAQRAAGPALVVGWDVDEVALLMAEVNLRVRGIPHRLHQADFLLDEGSAESDLAQEPPDAVIANPPWCRDRVLSPDYRRRIGEAVARRIDISLKPQTGLHAFFLLRALEVAAPGARLAFLAPAGWLDAAYGRPVQHYLLKHAHVEGYIPLTKQRLAFDGVLAAPALTLLRKTTEPGGVTRVVELGDNEPEPTRVLAALAGENVGLPSRELELNRTGSLTRPARRRGVGVPLGQLAQVRRGLATGHNRFFVLAESTRGRLGIEAEMLRPCLYQPRLFDGLEIHDRDLERLPPARPRWLIDPPEDFEEHRESPLGSYLAWGRRELHVHERNIPRRRPTWYRYTERLGSCPIVLGVFHKHGSARFIRNRSSAVPIAAFHIVQPRSDAADLDEADRLWRALNHPSVETQLQGLARTYGNGLWKLEPRALTQVIVRR